MFTFRFSAWTLTRFTVRYAKVLIVDDTILIIFIDGEVYVAHMENMIHDLLDHRRKARHICTGCDLIVVCPLSVLELVNMPQLKEKKEESYNST